MDRIYWENHNNETEYCLYDGNGHENSENLVKTNSANYCDDIYKYNNNTNVKSYLDCGGDGVLPVLPTYNTICESSRNSAVNFVPRHLIYDSTSLDGGSVNVGQHQQSQPQPQQQQQYQLQTHANNLNQFVGQNLPAPSYNEQTESSIGVSSKMVASSFNNMHNNSNNIIQYRPQQHTQITAAPQYYGNNQTYAPCQGPRPWDYGYCYGYYGEPACQFVQTVDIEDFMSNEKRKEKSRDAARCRRSRETEIFTELACVIPVRREDIEHLDKASVMRLAISFLKVRDVLKLFPNVDKDLAAAVEEKTDKIKDEETKPLDMFWNNAEIGQYLYESLDGFLLMLSSEGDITYASESISEYLGISQIDILGQQIWEYMHQCDHEELKEALNIRKNKVPEKDKGKDDEKTTELTTVHRDLMIRFKCTLTSRGRSVNIKSASYKVIHLTGHMIIDGNGEKMFIGIGRPLPHPSNIEIPMGTSTFLTKHSLDMKFTYVDDKMQSLLKYSEDDLLGKSLYDCHHGADSESLRSTFKIALSKGQSESSRYRFLGKFGGYCWLVTQASVIYEKQKPQSVVCINYVISNIEKENEIYSCEQLEATNLIKKDIKLPEIDDKLNINTKTNTQDNPQIIKDQLKINASVIKSVGVVDEIIVKEIKCTTVNNRENSLSPIRRTFNNCTISKELQLDQQAIQRKDIKLIVSGCGSGGDQQQQSNCLNGGNSIITKQLIDKRPKSVTASVLTQVRPSSTSSSSSSSSVTGITPSSSVQPVNLNSTIATSERNTILLNHNNLSQINIAPRAQSVTASIFKTFGQRSGPSANGCSTAININNSSDNNSVFGLNNPIKVQFFSPIPQLQHTQHNQQHQQQLQQSNRSEDNMNKGFLSFADDTPELTMLKEEPDELSHMPSTSGDSCIQLDEPTPLFGEMLDGLILPDAYCSLLPDDINSLDSQHSNNTNNNNNNNNHHHHHHQQQQNNNNNSVSIDPFINYRDESSDTNSSPHLLSPGGLAKSPEASSVPSLCSPHSLNQDDEFAFMTMSVDDDIDLTMRAPYIPMNEQDDLPLLTDDLMWSAFSEDDIQMQDTALKNALINCYSLSGTGGSPATSTTPSSNPTTQNHHHQQNSTLISVSSPMMQSQISINHNNNNNNNHNNISHRVNGTGGNLILNNDSNLANMLCGGVAGDDLNVLQHQQDNVDCKKRKYDENICDSIDAFGQVFSNKNSSGLDCWTMNDLLQLNSTTNHETKPNIIINSGQIQNGTSSSTTTATTTIHVPLITIQNNQKINNALNTRLNITISNNCNMNNNNSHHHNHNNNQNNNNNNNNNNNMNIKDENCTTTNLNHNNQNNLNNKINNSTATSKLLTSCNNSTLATSSVIGVGGVVGSGSLSAASTQRNLINNNNSSSVTLNLVSGSGGGNCGRSDIINSHNNNKRHLSGTSTLDSKRAKNNNNSLSTAVTSNCGVINIPPPASSSSSSASSSSSSSSASSSLSSTSTSSTSPLLSSTSLSSTSSSSASRLLSQERKTATNLLQQLMAPTPQQQRQHQLQKSQKLTFDKLNKWGDNENFRDNNTNTNNHHKNNKNVGIGNQGHSQQSPSNSVLKNLLVSGCDVPSPLTPLITDDGSQDSLKLINFNQKLLSPYFGSAANHQQTGQFMRNYGTNPMIGGTGILPSPPLPHQSNSPIGSDSGNDSGIECNRKFRLEDHQHQGQSCRIRHADEFFRSTPPSTPSALSPNCKDNYIMTSQLIGVETIPVESSSPIQRNRNKESTTVAAVAAAANQPSQNKIPCSSPPSYMETSNPFGSPFLMELCNDDYTAPIMSDEFLAKDFTDWTRNVI